VNDTRMVSRIVDIEGITVGILEGITLSTSRSRVAFGARSQR
jgi:hypothetical protein